MAPDRATARHQPPLSDARACAAGSSAQPDTTEPEPDTTERYKRAAAEAAAAIVQDGMRVGLGTGSTVAHLLPALADRNLRDLRCAATSLATERAARELGLIVEDLDALGELDIAIDGADQVDPSGWLIKGGGAAQTREKIVAAAARVFVVIVSAEKVVPALSPPVPLELLRFGVARTLAEVGRARLREEPRGSGETDSGSGETRGRADSAGGIADGYLLSPDGNLIADYLAPIGDPATLAARLSATPGVVEHGLFAPEMVSYVLIAGAAGVERRAGGKRDPS
jgi:ribose 5-phosphate isomerase A